MFVKGDSIPLHCYPLKIPPRPLGTTEFCKEAISVGNQLQIRRACRRI